MANVPVRARIRKSPVSGKSPKCPVCGTTLVVETDTPDRTTLACPKCRKGQMGEWVGTDDGYKLVRKLARKHKSLAMGDVDDLTSEAVVALLEHPCPADVGADGFADWVEGVVKAAAGKMRDVELREARAVDGEILSNVVPDREACELDTLEAWEEKEKADRNRAERVKRAISKLPPAQANAIRIRFFGQGNLAAIARESGKCDSAERMNLLRGTRKLASLIDADGYAVAA